MKGIRGEVLPKPALVGEGVATFEVQLSGEGGNRRRSSSFRRRSRAVWYYERATAVKRRGRAARAREGAGGRARGGEPGEGRRVTKEGGVHNDCCNDFGSPASGRGGVRLTCSRLGAGRRKEGAQRCTGRKVSGPPPQAPLRSLARALTLPRGGLHCGPLPPGPATVRRPDRSPRPAGDRSGPGGRGRWFNREAASRRGCRERP